MLKVLFLFISITLSITLAERESARIISEEFQKFDLYESMKYLANDPSFRENASDECLSTMIKYANNFQNYSTEIGLMVFNSGRDINDLGRFDDCNALDFTRYISLSVNGLPLGIYLGICGPKECTDKDYLPASEQLAKIAIAVSGMLPDAEAFKVDWTKDNFVFQDSLKRNAENTSVTPAFIVAI